MTTKRHSWGQPTRIPNATAIPRKTERRCIDCLIVKVTWHEMDGSRETYRTEFWRGLDKIECAGTPACGIISEEKVA